MELNQWRSREERFSKLFSFSLSTNRALLREKLHHYERIAAKYKGTYDQDERFALNILRQESRRMEKQLYPNLFISLFRRLLVTPLREQSFILKDTRGMEQNSRSLLVQLQQAGFPDLFSKLEEQLKQGQDQFSISVSYYANEKERMEHHLTFSRDQLGN